MEINGNLKIERKQIKKRRENNKKLKLELKAMDFG